MRVGPPAASDPGHDRTNAHKALIPHKNRLKSRATDAATACMKYPYILFPGLLALLMGAATALAHPPLVHPATSPDADQAPDAIPGAVTLDADGLLQLIALQPDLTLIDARLRSDRKFGYIENSLSLPNTETNCASLARLVPSLEHPVAFYCNGPKCERSGISVRKALACGYKRVFWFRGGIQEWSGRRYPLLK
ncbi:MAG TPA: rhodanese-like domain-containing protein [Gammaproteobacteria bacterium]|nr:rhodanese-like domain-containing protein [Gammaproteobacteria bacterium]